MLRPITLSFVFLGLLFSAGQVSATKYQQTRGEVLERRAPEPVAAPAPFPTTATWMGKTIAIPDEVIATKREAREKRMVEKRNAVNKRDPMTIGRRFPTAALKAIKKRNPMTVGRRFPTIVAKDAKRDSRAIGRRYPSILSRVAAEKRVAAAKRNPMAIGRRYPSILSRVAAAKRNPMAMGRRYPSILSRIAAEKRDSNSAYHTSKRVAAVKRSPMTIGRRFPTITAKNVVKRDTMTIGRRYPSITMTVGSRFPSVSTRVAAEKRDFNSAYHTSKRVAAAKRNPMTIGRRFPTVTAKNVVKRDPVTIGRRFASAITRRAPANSAFHTSKRTEFAKVMKRSEGYHSSKRVAMPAPASIGRRYPFPTTPSGRLIKV